MTTHAYYYLPGEEEVFPTGAPEGVQALLREVWGAIVPPAKKKDDPTLVAGDRVACPYDGVSFWVNGSGAVVLSVTTATYHPGTSNPLRTDTQRPDLPEYKRRFGVLVGA